MPAIVTRLLAAITSLATLAITPAWLAWPLAAVRAIATSAVYIVTHRWTWYAIGACVLVSAGWTAHGHFERTSAAEIVATAKAEVTRERDRAIRAESARQNAEAEASRSNDHAATHRAALNRLLGGSLGVDAASLAPVPLSGVTNVAKLAPPAQACKLKPHRADRNNDHRRDHADRR